MSEFYQGKRRSMAMEVTATEDEGPTYDDYLTLRDLEIRHRVAAYEASLRAHYELNPHIAEVFRESSLSHETEAEGFANQADAMEEAVRGALA